MNVYHSFIFLIIQKNLYFLVVEESVHTSHTKDQYSCSDVPSRSECKVDDPTQKSRLVLAMERSTSPAD